MTNRFASHRTFSANHTSQSHLGIPPQETEGIILSDFTTESKTPARPYPLQYLKGVGPMRAQALARMGIFTPLDLIYTFPRDWEDRRCRFSIRPAPIGEKTTLCGSIQSIVFSNPRYDLGIATATLRDSTGSIEAVWFRKTNLRFDVFSSLRQRLKRGCQLMVFGMVETGFKGRQLRVEEMAILPSSNRTLSPEDALHLNRIVPLYTVNKNISERLVRSLLARLMPTVSGSVSPIIPHWLEEKRQWPSKRWALEKIHFPNSFSEKEKAREYLAFEEFFTLEVALGVLRQKSKQRAKPHTYQVRKTLLTPFREQLGFSFTAAQKRVIREVFDDLTKPFPMNRLLQGDVGSGKTVVALSAMLLAVENGGQAALMAPTEILADQHALTFARFLNSLGVRWVSLTGRQTPSQRRKILHDISEGKVAVVVGTHALIQKPVQFSKLMLVVIDEQHRFGVEHRGLLRQKGQSPDVLVLTATPIPRTLALTVYGDLDVSILDELPPGRAPIITQHVSEAAAYQHILKEIAAGHQAYLVFPLVKESDKMELKAVVQEATRLSQSLFRDVRVGLLHGQLTSQEKETIMEQFRQKQLDLLIATSIIEVGIDIPNATLIAIQHAERFGLSTLHQLRGRVGRGPFASSCLLIAETKTEEARRRIRIMMETLNGFRLSEEDLALRGPGDVLGVNQHGRPLFKIGHLIRDARLIQEARQAADDLLQTDPVLRRPEHAALKENLHVRFRHDWTWGTMA